MYLWMVLLPVQMIYNFHATCLFLSTKRSNHTKSENQIKVIRITSNHLQSPEDDLYKSKHVVLGDNLLQALCLHIITQSVPLTTGPLSASSPYKRPVLSGTFCIVQ